MNRICFAVVAGSLFLVSGCGCGEDQYDRNTACREIVSAVEEAVTECSQPSYTAPFVCEATCEHSGCIDKADVERCREGILSLACDRITTGSIEQLEACGSVLEDVAEPCARDGDNDHDLFDD